MGRHRSNPTSSHLSRENDKGEKKKRTTSRRTQREEREHLEISRKNLGERKRKKKRLLARKLNDQWKKDKTRHSQTLRSKGRDSHLLKRRRSYGARKQQKYIKKQKHWGKR